MAFRLFAALLLLASPVAAQTPGSARTPGSAQTLGSGQSPRLAATGAVPTTPPAAYAPAPVPNPLVSPDLQPQLGSAPSLAALVRQSSWQDAVIASAREQFKELQGSCAAASFKPTGELVLYAPLQFAQDGTLASGVWSERVSATGCGAPRQLNVLTIVQPGQPAARIPTMPGDSHADPQTQKNALQYAQAIAARAAPPGCTRQTFTEAKFLGYTGLPNQAVRDRESRAWREAWSLYACGTNYIIEMTFEPNPQGIQLSATNPIKRP